MKITWLGQAGLYFETEGLRIVIDPYLSDSVEKVNPRLLRRVAVDPSLLGIGPDIIVLTHDHLDHTDPETLGYYLTEDKPVTVLAPEAAWRHVQDCRFKGMHNYVKFNRHSEWTAGNVRFRAVKAEHSDVHPIGVLIEAEGKTYYVTGDTLYNTDIFEDIPSGIEAVFLPVNGVGNNMTMTDGARFCHRVGPRFAVPMHCGLFDSLDLHDFPFDRKIVPEFYREIHLG